MKIYVYYDDENDRCFCEATEMPFLHGGPSQVIEADPTNKKLTEDWEGQGIEIGEVFQCNDIVSNLIRVA